MNGRRTHLNESDLEDRITKKKLKELKVIIYTNKVHLHFRGSIIKTLNLVCFT